MKVNRENYKRALLFVILYRALLVFYLLAEEQIQL